MNNEQQLNLLNEHLLEALNNSGDYFISDTVLDGKFVLRIAIGNIKTTEEDVSGLRKAIQADYLTLRSRLMSHPHVDQEGMSTCSIHSPV